MTRESAIKKIMATGLDRKTANDYLSKAHLYDITNEEAVKLLTKCPWFRLYLDAKVDAQKDLPGAFSM